MLYSGGKLYNVLRFRGNGSINCARRLSLGRFAVQRRRRGTAAERRCQLDVRLSVGSYRLISGGRGGGGGRCGSGRPAAAGGPGYRSGGGICRQSGAGV